MEVRRKQRATYKRFIVIIKRLKSRQSHDDVIIPITLRFYFKSQLLETNCVAISCLIIIIKSASNAKFILV